MKELPVLDLNCNEIISSIVNHASKKNIYIGYSGGLDSTVLLHFVANNIKNHNITAIHINHQLQPQADYWQSQCEEFAKANHIEILCHKIKLAAKGNIEAEARAARIKIWQQQLREADLLLLGQHADDLAETVLFRIVRGTGILGLEAIKPFHQHFGYKILRPFLRYNKKNLLQYANYHNLSWCEDLSNIDNRFDRNFLRNEIIPKLKQRWPKVDVALNSLSNHASNYNEIITKNNLLDVHNRVGICEITKLATFDISDFHKKPEQYQSIIIRHWFDYLKIEQLSQKQLRVFLHEFVCIRSNNYPMFKIGNYEFRKYRNYLYFTKKGELQKLRVVLPAPLFDRINAKKGSSRKKLLQQLKIPSWARNYIFKE